jgi:hypothetical protein
MPISSPKPVRHRHPARRQSRNSAADRSRADRGRRSARGAGGIRDGNTKAHVEVIEAGGLFIVGSERYESRRIDNQLRGRSGRQGDPGASKFFRSLEDDLGTEYCLPRTAQFRLSHSSVRRYTAPSAQSRSLGWPNSLRCPLASGEPARRRTGRGSE